MYADRSATLRNALNFLRLEKSAVSAANWFHTGMIRSVKKMPAQVCNSNNKNSKSKIDTDMLNTDASWSFKRQTAHERRKV
jgi:hypothetical protein